MSYFDDVRDFHDKFGLPTDRTGGPVPLTPDLLRFRGKFMIEELAEFLDASGHTLVAKMLKDMSVVLMEEPDQRPNLEEAADALADLTYVVLGTALFMHLPFEKVWEEVQRANMTKVRASGADDPLSKRQHAADVVKPPGFRKPDHRPALSRAILDAESRCEGHVAAWHDGRVCGRCGTHVNSLI